MNMKEYWEEQSKIRMLHLARENLFDDYWTKRYLRNLKYLNGGERILDIGCGDARYFVKLTDRFNDFYGIELSKVHFESAKILFPTANYIVADGRELPIKDSSFDTVISFGAFGHNEDIDSIFKDCYRFLDNNGVLLFSVPNYISPFFPYWYIRCCAIKKQNRVSAIGHHYSRKQLKTKLQRAGFKTVKIVDSIYAAPIPVVKLWEGLLKKARGNRYGKSQTEQTEMEIKAVEKHEKKLKKDYHVGTISLMNSFIHLNVLDLALCG
jgi:SAM-dependent methyltransferase